jgi:hypothetical protein
MKEVLIIAAIIFVITQTTAKEVPVIPFKTATA